MCHEMGPQYTYIWYPSRGNDWRIAKDICDVCPVKKECLQFALDTDEGEGIWGGTSERQRRRMRSERKKNRVRESA